VLRRFLDSPWIYFGLAGVLLVAAVLSQIEIHVPSRPMGEPEDILALRDRDDVNVVFIVVDTLRADRLGINGYQRPTSPVLDDLSRYGVNFSNVEAQSSWTKSSMASMWTSLNTHRTGVTRFAHALPAEAVTPAEILREAGFATGAVWRNAWVAPNFGFGQGFEIYLQPTPSTTREKLRRRTPGVHPLQGTDLDVLESGSEYIRSRLDDRFFLYIHLMDVHQYVYDEAAADLIEGPTFSDHYDRALNWVDRVIGGLLLELEDNGIFERTLVVIASDHGEGFFEHDLEGHARTLYREVTAVPMIFALPFRLDPGIAVDSLVRNIDVWPTILELLGLPPLPDADGRSLVPLILQAARGGQGDVDPPAALSFLDFHWARTEENSLPIRSIREGTTRLLLGPGEDRVGLYDHSSDPWEQVNLAEAQPERVAELRGRIEEAERAGLAWGEPAEVEIDRLRREQLRALGYVEDPRRPAMPEHR
jgi:arylsulfatase A-like enzyme